MDRRRERPPRDPARPARPPPRHRPAADLDRDGVNRLPRDRRRRDALRVPADRRGHRTLARDDPGPGGGAESAPGGRRSPPAGTESAAGRFREALREPGLDLLGMEAEGAGLALVDDDALLVDDV